MVKTVTILYQICRLSHSRTEKGQKMKNILNIGSDSDSEVEVVEEEKIRPNKVQQKNV